jgi:hypothetical protein
MGLYMCVQSSCKFTLFEGGGDRLGGSVDAARRWSRKGHVRSDEAMSDESLRWLLCPKRHVNMMLARFCSAHFAAAAAATYRDSAAESSESSDRREGGRADTKGQAVGNSDAGGGRILSR